MPRGTACPAHHATCHPCNSHYIPSLHACPPPSPSPLHTTMWGVWHPRGRVWQPSGWGDGVRGGPPPRVSCPQALDPPPHGPPPSYPFEFLSLFPWTLSPPASMALGVGLGGPPWVEGSHGCAQLCPLVLLAPWVPNNAPYCVGCPGLGVAREAGGTRGAHDHPCHVSPCVTWTSGGPWCHVAPPGQGAWLGCPACQALLQQSPLFN